MGDGAWPWPGLGWPLHGVAQGPCGRGKAGSAATTVAKQPQAAAGLHVAHARGVGHGVGARGAQQQWPQERRQSAAGAGWPAQEGARGDAESAAGDEEKETEARSATKQDASEWIRLHEGRCVMGCLVGCGSASERQVNSIIGGSRFKNETKKRLTRLSMH